MRAFPIDELNFLETVQIFFLELTGKGLVLGSRDAELLQAWRAEGASAAAVCQGIDDAVRAMPDTPRSIAACRRWVEPRVEAARSARTGGHEATSEASPAPEPVSAPGRRVEEWADQALGVIAHAGESVEREEFKAAYRLAYRRVRESLERDEDVARVLLEVENQLSDDFFAALSPDEREAIDSELGESSQARRMGERARASFLSAKRREILESRYGLVSIF